MDHLCGKDAPESAMTVDFATGLALGFQQPQAWHLPVAIKFKGSLCDGHRLLPGTVPPQHPVDFGSLSSQDIGGTWSTTHFG